VSDGSLPPHDIEAEVAVLSACILHPDPSLDLVDGLVEPADFYSDAHRILFQAVIGVSSDGSAVDLVSIRGRLKDAGQLDRVGGTEYLVRVTHATPAISNVVQHAETVRDKARLRRFISVCQRAAAEAHGDCGDPQEYIDATEQKLSAIAQAGSARSMVDIGEAVGEALESVATASRSGASGVTGARTGFDDVDRLTTGMHPGELFIVAGRPGMGKALKDGQRVLTPGGWKRVESLRVGDLVMGADGLPTIVQGVFPQGTKETFSVETSDGCSVEVCGEHLWVTRTRSDRRAGLCGAVRTTADIARTLHRSDGGLNHSIQFAAKMRWSEREPSEIPIDPYVLGVWLGDGSGQRIHNPEKDVVFCVEQRWEGGSSRFNDGCGGVSLLGIKRYLMALGLLCCRSHEKFIPEAYLLGCWEHRQLLLNGLCDSDGYVCDPHGKGIEYCTTSEKLRDDVEFLVRSLGGRAKSAEHQGSYRKNGELCSARQYWRINLSFPGGDIMPVSSDKNLKKWVGGELRLRERYIARVIPTGRSSCTCIKVSNEDGMFVTEGFIVTHNTSYVLNVAANMTGAREVTPGNWEQSDLAAAFFSLEMPTEQLALRLLAAEARVDVSRLRSGSLNSDDWSRITDKSRAFQHMLLRVDDTPAISLGEVRAKSRRYQAELRHKGKRLGLIAIDYLQLMRGRRNAHSREQEVSELSRGLKQLAKELEVPVLALSQLNRSVESRHDKRPQLSDLRESGAIEQDADTIIFIYRDEYYNMDSVDMGVAEVIIAKQRNGPTGTVRTRFTSAYTRFDNLEEIDEEPSYARPRPGDVDDWGFDRSLD
jgi:replicative DNA helicase